FHDQAIGPENDGVASRKRGGCRGGSSAALYRTSIVLCHTACSIRSAAGTLWRTSGIQYFFDVHRCQALVHLHMCHQLIKSLPERLEFLLIPKNFYFCPAGYQFQF